LTIPTERKENRSKSAEEKVMRDNEKERKKHMKRKKQKRVVSLVAVFMALLTVVVSPSSLATGSLVAEKEAVISENLQAKIDSKDLSPTDQLEVMIWTEDYVDDEEVVKMTEEATGLSLEEITASIPLLSEEDYWAIKDLDDEKFAEEMEKRIDREALAENEKNSLLVNQFIEAKRKISSSLYEKQNAKIVKEMGLKSEEIDYVSRYSPVITCKLTATRVNEIAAQKGVLQMEYVGGIKFEPEATTISQVVSDSNATYLKNNYGWTGSGVKVGILESTSYVTSAAGVGSVTKVTNSEATINPNEPLKQDHANLVGAIIAGSSGFAPDATVYSTISGYKWAGFLSGVELLIDRSVHVINMSLSLSKDEDNNTIPKNGQYQDLDAWCDHITSQHNIVFVKSAGNEGTDTKFITSPGMAYNAITVGNHNGSELYETSSYKEGTGLRPEKPDIVARGSVQVSLPNSTYKESGTSFSAAAVTGVLAELMEGNGNLKVRPTLAKATICAGARYWCGEYGRYLGIHSFSNTEGAGKLNAKCAASIITAGRYHYTSGGTTSHTITDSFSVTSSDAVIKICMTWEKRNFWNHSNESEDDYASLANWNLTVSGPSGVYKSEGSTNNMEIIYIEAPQSGTYTITATRGDAGSAAREYVSIAWY